MQKILMSACLLGAKVRYDGKDCLQDNAILQRWIKEGRIVNICPEVAGGMGVPRPPSEIMGPGGGVGVLQGKAVIQNNQGEDVTAEYLTGAQLALKLAQEHNIKIAILKENSPSCGSSHIYDGTFQRQKIEGQGITAALLSANGIKVFDEHQIAEVAALLKD